MGFFLVETAFEQLMLSETDSKKRLQTSSWRHEVFEKSYDQKTKKFPIFFGKIDIFGQNGPFFSLKLPLNNLS